MTERKGLKKASLEDWHRGDIKSALEKAGWNLSSLSRYHGYGHRNTLQTALRRPWPKGERYIADAIGIDPAEIWPSRYQGKDSIQARKGHRGDVQRKAA
ncbi:transcriptional regulator [Marinobacter halodurans]|uniref:Transcriptional regulator n=1 Tax=Marinobacter halodurans TaxID=2528979 RepID=A0ABY1ZSU4_9GAMM|nr:helix-turn-helix domain-containing protein [Marinobacter halodurans]TBW58523.1 transcriptional regulator [Marinobacter halodurans]